MEIYRTLNRKIDDYFGIPFLPAWQQMQPWSTASPARPPGSGGLHLRAPSTAFDDPTSTVISPFSFFYTAHHNGYTLLAITLLLPEIQNWVNLEGASIVQIYKDISTRLVWPDLKIGQKKIPWQMEWVFQNDWIRLLMWSNNTYILMILSSKI